MEAREDKFLKKAFAGFDPEAEPAKDFNQYVIHKINARHNFGNQVLHSLRIVAPVLFVFLLAGILALVFKGDLLVQRGMAIIPSLRPWHIFMAFIMIYFHFVRSVLILAFLYFKNTFTKAGFPG